MTLFNGQVETVGKFWWINVRYPMSDTTISIRDVILSEAKKRKKTLIVNCPGGQEIITPELWRKEGRKIYKTFLRPDEPMVLYERKVRANNNPKPKEAFLFY